MPNNTTFILSKECQTIIKNNSPEKSIELISNIKSSINSKKIGREKALKIYTLYGNHSVEYDKKIYQNNINKYVKKIDSNIKKASNFV